MIIDMIAVSTTLLTLLAVWVGSKILAKVKYYLGLPEKVSDLEWDLRHAKRDLESTATYSRSYQDALKHAHGELEAAKSQLRALKREKK